MAVTYPVNIFWNVVLLHASFNTIIEKQKLVNIDPYTIRIL